MDFFKQFDKDLRKQQKDMDRGLKEQEKQMNKSLGAVVKTSIAQEKRKRIDAKLRKKVYEKYNHTCAWRSCNEKSTLDVHHKNMNPKQNNLNNLELLCPTHHRKRHEEKFRKRIKTYDIIHGEKTRTKLIKKKKLPKKIKSKLKKPTKKKTSLHRDFKIPKFDLRI